MNPKQLIQKTFLALSITCLLALPAFAEDPPPDTDTDTTADTEEDTDGSKFDDRDRLVETLLSDDTDDISDADAALTEVNEALVEAEEALEDTTDQDEIDALTIQVSDLKEQVTEAENALEAANNEEELIRVQVGDLTAEQVFALNRSLNNAVSSGLIVDFDSEQLQDVLDGEYNKQQINSLTKALESEAKFT